MKNDMEDFDLTKKVNELLAQIEGYEEENYPANINFKGNNGFNYLRSDFPGYYSIYISKGDFYWFISIDYEGNYWKGEDTKIKGYQHKSTNPESNIETLKAALEDTKAFFPKPNLPDHSKISYLHTDQLKLLFEQLLKKEIDLETYLSSSQENLCCFISYKNKNSTEDGEKQEQEETNQFETFLKSIYPNIKIKLITLEDKNRIEFEVAIAEITKIFTTMNQNSELINLDLTYLSIQKTTKLDNKENLAMKVLFKNQSVNENSLTYLSGFLGNLKNNEDNENNKIVPSKKKIYTPNLKF